MQKTTSTKTESFETTNTILNTLKSLRNNTWESHYKNVEKIASGGNATVFKANRCKNCTSLQPSADDLELCNNNINDTNTPTAIKKSRSINTQKLLNSDFLTEINTLKKFSHKNIIQFFNAWIQEKLEKPRKCSEELLKKKNNNISNNNNNDEQQQDSTNSTYCPYNTNLSTQYNNQDTTLEEEFSPLINKRRKLSSSPIKANKHRLVANKLQLLATNNNNICSQQQQINHNNNSKSNTSNNNNKLNLSSGYQENILTMPKRVYGFIETELCQDNLNDYIQARNKQFFKDQNSSEKKQQFIKEALQISNQILDALNYMHEAHQTAHLDLKPQNIFLNYLSKNNNNSNIQVKLGDFGSAKTFENFEQIIQSKKGKNLPYTQMYASPEFLALKNNKLQKNQTVKPREYDLFSLGVLLLELFIPVSTSMELIGLLKTYKEKTTEQQQQDNCLIPELRLLIQQLLSIQPNNRPKLTEILTKISEIQQEQDSQQKADNEEEQQQQLQLLTPEIELMNEKLQQEQYLFVKNNNGCLLKSQLSELSAASTQLSESGFYQNESTRCIVNNLEKVLYDAQAFDREEDDQNTGSNIF